MADTYNRPDFHPPPGGYENVDFQPDLRAGMLAPEFELPDVDGGTVSLKSVLRDRHAVLVFGSITSPVTATHLPELNRMWEYFSWRPVQFLFIYTGEIHPGERYPHHTSLEQKLAAARDFKRAEEVRFPVLVDSLDGKLHRAYGSRPNPSFVVNREGRLVYRTPSVDPPTLREYLTHLLLWDEVKALGRPAHFVYMEQVRFQLPDAPSHAKVLERAGPKAVHEQLVAHPEEGKVK
jgi:hypothetical protein